MVTTWICKFLSVYISNINSALNYTNISWIHDGSVCNMRWNNIIPIIYFRTTIFEALVMPLFPTLSLWGKFKYKWKCNIKNNNFHEDKYAIVFLFPRFDVCSHIFNVFSVLDTLWHVVLWSIITLENIMETNIWRCW